MRREADVPDLVFVTLAKDPLVVVLPSDHRLATQDAISLKDLVGDSFIIVAQNTPTLRVIIDAYLAQSGVAITPVHEVDNLSMAMSLVSSTRGVALLSCLCPQLPALVGHQPAPKDGRGASGDRSRSRLPERACA